MSGVGQGPFRTKAYSCSCSSSSLDDFKTFCFLLLELLNGQCFNATGAKYAPGQILNRLNLEGRKRRKHEFYYVKGSAHVSFTDFTRQRGRAERVYPRLALIRIKYCCMRAVAWLLLFLIFDG